MMGMGQLQVLARQLGADERTLRRAVALGAVRARRPGPRRLAIADEERVYLRDHWPLLSDLRHALRTEPNVRLAVLYGSAARGDDDHDSDVDLLIDFEDDSADAAARVGLRLRRALGRSVDIARLSRVEDTAPLLLVDALEEGRVLIDRAQRWPALQNRRAVTERRAAASFARQRADARQALAALTGEQR